MKENNDQRCTTKRKIFNQSVSIIAGQYAKCQWL